jgi:hypothetical protein
MAVLRYAAQEAANIAKAEKRARQQGALNASIALRKAEEAAETEFQPLADVLTNTTASFTATLETKLNGIATGATANSADAVLLDRANHTGEQAISTVTGLQAALDGKLGTWVSVPATATSTGTAGQIAYDGTHFFVCSATDTWLRVAIATW